MSKADYGNAFAIALVLIVVVLAINALTKVATKKLS